MVKMSRLIQIRNELDKAKKRVFSFEIKFKYIKLEVVLCYLEPFIMIIKNKNLYLNIEINEKYEISNLSSFNIKNLKDILKWNDKTIFDLEYFLKFINVNIPNYVYKEEKPLKDYFKYLKNYVEESNKTYYCGQITNDKDGKRVSIENLNKTLIFLGDDCYKYFKNNNISSCWTTKKILFSNNKYKKYAERYKNKK